MGRLSVGGSELLKVAVDEQGTQVGVWLDFCVSARQPEVLGCGCWWQFGQKRTLREISTAPCAAAHGTPDTFAMASAKSTTSITLNPAIGREGDRKGPSTVSTLAAFGLRTWTGLLANPINAPSACNFESCS